MAENRLTHISRRKFLAASLASLAAAGPIEVDERDFYPVDLRAIANVN